MAESFREFYTRRNGTPFPGHSGERLDVAMKRLADSLADWADEIANRVTEKVDPAVEVE